MRKVESKRKAGITGNFCVEKVPLTAAGKDNRNPKI